LSGFFIRFGLETGGSFGSGFFLSQALGFGGFLTRFFFCGGLETGGFIGFGFFLG
jgi:hypothetical protein